MKIKFYFAASILACTLVFFSSCDTQSVSGVNISLAGYEELLGRDISPLIVQNINTPENYNPDAECEHYFRKNCLINVTIKFDKKLDEYLLACLDDAKRRNDCLHFSYLTAVQSSGVILNSAGDTLLRFSRGEELANDFEPLSFTTHAKLYKNYQNLPENPILSEWSGEILTHECGDIESINGTMSQYKEDNEGKLFCCRKIVWLLFGYNYTKTVIDFYPNGSPKEYSLYNNQGTRELRKRYDKYGREITNWRR